MDECTKDADQNQEPKEKDENPGDPITLERSEDEQKAVDVAQAEIDEAKRLLDMREAIVQAPTPVQDEEPIGVIINQEKFAIQMHAELVAVLDVVLTKAPALEALAKANGRTSIASALRALTVHAEHVARKTKGVQFWKKVGN